MNFWCPDAVVVNGKVIMYGLNRVHLSCKFSYFSFSFLLSLCVCVCVCVCLFAGFCVCVLVGLKPVHLCARVRNFTNHGVSLAELGVNDF